MPAAVTATVSALQMEDDKAEEVEAAGRKDQVYAGCVVCVAEVQVQVLAVPATACWARELVMDKVYAHVVEFVAEYIQDTQAKDLYEAGFTFARRTAAATLRPTGSTPKRWDTWTTRCRVPRRSRSSCANHPR